ncbi:MAG: hypothetical protein HYX47_06425 [Burkholderiales bacterium]|nr:hypothetical protein [Burkholderiales bacterium]
MSIVLSACGGAAAAPAAAAPSCNTFESYVGGGKINIVDFTAMGGSSALRFRLKVNSFQNVAADGYFGALTTGDLTYSYPRQNNPQVAYDKTAPFPAGFTKGPAFGEKVRYMAREIGCNVFQVTWKETEKGDTVTHVEDFGRQQVCTNITNINMAPIPAGFDPFDKASQLNSAALFPAGSPAAGGGFFTNLCGTMSQSPEADRVWENALHSLVYTAP